MIETYNKILKFNKEKNDVEIILKEKTPEYLYKYYSLNKNSINNLKYKKIHFSHPYNLNDIMDGNFQLFDINETYKNYIERTKREDVSLEEFRRFFYQSSNEYYKHIGVFCLTNSYNNNLFWPHYTFEQGFSIEFNSSKLINSFRNEHIKILPITYGELKSINLNNYVVENTATKNGSLGIETDIRLGLYYILSNKDDIWKYENEWRIILKKENLGQLSHPLNTINDDDYKTEFENLKQRNFEYDPNSINKIILSNLFFHKSRFNKQLRNGNYETFYFRQTNKKEDKNLLINFIKEIKDNFNDKIYQIDRHHIPDKNKFISKITFAVKIIELDNDKVTIERKYCS